MILTLIAIALVLVGVILFIFDKYQTVIGLIKSESKELKEAINSLKGTDRNDTEHERDCELCKKIQNDLYQMSAKYNVSNQQDYFIVMGIYLAIELIAKNYVNKTDDDTEYELSKKYLHDPVEVDRVFKNKKGDNNNDNHHTESNY